MYLHLYVFDGRHKRLKTAKDKLKMCSNLRIVSENYLKNSEAEEDKRVNVLHEKNDK